MLADSLPKSDLKATSASAVFQNFLQLIKTLMVFIKAHPTLLDCCADGEEAESESSGPQTPIFKIKGESLQGSDSIPKALDSSFESLMFPSLKPGRNTRQVTPRTPRKMKSVDSRSPCDSPGQAAETTENDRSLRIAKFILVNMKDMGSLELQSNVCELELIGTRKQLDCQCATETNL